MTNIGQPYYTPESLTMNDIVRLSEGVGSRAQQAATYKITRKLKTNVVITPLNGGKDLTVNPSLLIKVPADMAEIAAARAAAQPTVEVYYLGEVVELTKGRFADGGLWVVLGSTSKGYKIAKLGGNGDRYVGGVQAVSLRKVPMEEFVQDRFLR